MSVILTNLGSTFNRGDFTNGNAFFWSSLDLSPYAGALGRTPHKVRLVDSAGKIALGYLAGVGAGETLGSELVDAWTNSPTYPYETWTPGVGNLITQAINTAAAEGIGFAIKEVGAGMVASSLLKCVNAITVASGTDPSVSIANNSSMGGSINFTFNGTSYKTVIAQTWAGINVGEPTDFALTSYSLKRVTDPPSTAVHIVSSLNGTTRNWASIESGFDPNSISSWSIEVEDSKRKRVGFHSLNGKT